MSNARPVAPGPYHYPCETHAGSHCPDCDGTGLVSHEGDAHELSREAAEQALEHEVHRATRGLARDDRVQWWKRVYRNDVAFFLALGAAALVSGGDFLRFVRICALCEVIDEYDEAAPLRSLKASVLPRPGIVAAPVVANDATRAA